MAGIDTLLGAAVDSVKRSGALEAGALSAVVTAVASDGTLTVTHGQDTYPRVRLLSGYSNPTVGAAVQILKTAGGWVCLGRQLSDNPAAWIPLPMASGWTRFHTNAYYPPGFRLNTDNTVQMCGVAGNTAGVSSITTIATLPAGYRPAFKVRFLSEVGTAIFGVVDVNTDGTVVISDFSGKASYCPLDQITFRLS